MTAPLTIRLARSAALGAIAVLVTATVPAAAHAQAREGTWQTPRTEHGHPDLQGNWTNATLTPIQRPSNQPAVLTAEQVAAIESGQAEVVEQRAQPTDPDRPLPPGGDNPVCIDGGTTCYNEVYRDPGDRVAVIHGEARSSLVTVPANGRVPPVTEKAREILAEARAFNAQFGAYDHPEVRPLAERCIVSFGSNAGPPMLPNYWYNNNYTIVQTADHVMIMTEMVHDVRVIQIGEPQDVPDGVTPYFGNSWGHWEGSTLVVETTDINPAVAFQGVPYSKSAKVTERFTRTAEDQIVYEFMIDDPEMYTATWGGEALFRRLDDLVYEYSCHEGNYALEGVLRGARFSESESSR